MLLNYCAVSLLLIASTAVALRSDSKKHKAENSDAKQYNADKNRLVKRFHGSKHAKIFLRGCAAESYVNLTANVTTESKSFELQNTREFVFAIFTLQEVSIILSNANDTNETIVQQKTNETDYDENENAREIVSFNITLGMNKNSVARMDIFRNGTSIGNITEERFALLPTIPYYVNISITDHNISVYEARTGASQPFLFYDFNLNSTTTVTSDKYFVKFEHSAPIFAHYDCCEACTPWIYTRISGCSKYSAITSSTKSETTHSLPGNSHTNRTEHFLFNQTVLVHHDGSPTFAAKIIFSESDTLRSNSIRYEIGLSDTPKILHYINSSTQHSKTLAAGVTLKREYISPFIVNITITKNGIVRLTLPYEDYPFLVYRASMRPVDVKHMTMVKFHDDFIRYDFYYNCTDLLCFTGKIELPTTPSTDVNVSDSYPMIWDAVSKQFNTVKYDVLHAFQDSYQINEKSNENVYEDSSDDDDETCENKTLNSVQQSSDNLNNKTSNGYWQTINKAIAGAASFLFIGFLKLILSLDCVRNLMKEVNLDDDQVNNLQKSVSTVVNKNMASTLGLEIDE